MRRALKILIITAAILAVVAPVKAQSFNWSGGVSITEMTPQSGIFSHIDVCRHGQVIGSWFSTAGVLPVIAQAPDLEYVAYGDFPGITKIEKVVLTPDGGKSQWPAAQMLGKGWQVQVPFGIREIVVQEVKDVKVRGNKTEKRVCEERKTIVGLETGGYALEWGVWSKDKKNRLMLIIIPINYTSIRTSAAANHLMVQTASTVGLNNIQVFALLRGFVPAWATPDPAVLAQQQMLQPSPQPIPVVPPPPSYQSGDSVQLDGVVRSENPTPPKPAAMVRTNLIFWCGKTKQTWGNQLIPENFFVTGQIVEFRRNSQFIGAAEVGSVRLDAGFVEFFIFRGGFPLEGDKLIIVEEGNR